MLGRHLEVARKFQLQMVNGPTPVDNTIVLVIRDDMQDDVIDVFGWVYQSRRVFLPLEFPNV